MRRAGSAQPLHRGRAAGPRQPRRLALRARAAARGHHADGGRTAQQLRAGRKRSAYRAGRRRHRRHADRLHGAPAGRAGQVVHADLLRAFARRGGVRRTAVGLWRRGALPLRRRSGRAAGPEGNAGRTGCADALLLLRPGPDAECVRGCVRGACLPQCPYRALRRRPVDRGGAGRRIRGAAVAHRLAGEGAFGQVAARRAARLRRRGRIQLPRRRVRLVRDRRAGRLPRPPRQRAEQQRARQQQDHDGVRVRLQGQQAGAGFVIPPNIARTPTVFPSPLTGRGQGEGWFNKSPRHQNRRPSPPSPLPQAGEGSKPPACGQPPESTEKFPC
ncbi:protein of unknown function (plasmid) [Cupriavidus taiwanensis]|uniref:4Fe-4S ferredoxin-type domain-containing protein n=1 Tax=Cupriavidus taiwanensis TaxID=164546 RepID=A0A9Q7V092_9BURK|nr:protein of unknown function [Cupriavidus taiwanensis]